MADLDRVVLQLKWRHQFQFAGYYAAVAQGYYREAGLDVRLQEAAPGRDPVDEVLGGRADFGVGTSELMLLRDQGKPVVVLAAIYQHSPLVLLARRQPGVEDLQALRDKPLMIEPLSAELFAYFKNEGIDPKKLNLLEHTFDVRDLISGRVAAMSAYATDEPFLLKQAGIDFLTFTPRAGGIDYYGDNLFTIENQIRTHPARVRAFLQASLRGWEYAMAHPEEMVDLILRSYDQRKSREHLLFEARQTALLIHPELIEIGHMNPGRWRHMADTYAEFGMISHPFPMDKFLYDPNPRPNLTWLYWSLVATGLVAAGSVGWALPIVRLNRHLRHEVAERRRVEGELRQATLTAESANQAKGRYLAVMTHEVRTPLNAIIGLSELLRVSPLPAAEREYAELIDQSAKSMLKLTNDVLDFEQIEAGHIELEQVPVVLANFVAGVCDLFRPAASSKGVTLREAIRPGAPSTIATDPMRLRQILANLISNAIKFTPSGGRVDLSVAVAESPPAHAAGENRVRLLFEVRDTGEGISPEQMPRLFLAYSQADPSVGRRFGGTGLGLVIAQRLAVLLGGGITVQSIPGSGSAFTAAIVVAIAPSA